MVGAMTCHHNGIGLIYSNWWILLFYLKSSNLRLGKFMKWSIAEIHKLLELFFKCKLKSGLINRWPFFLISFVALFKSNSVFMNKEFQWNKNRFSLFEKLPTADWIFFSCSSSETKPKIHARFPTKCEMYKNFCQAKNYTKQLTVLSCSHLSNLLIFQVFFLSVVVVLVDVVHIIIVVAHDSVYEVETNLEFKIYTRCMKYHTVKINES